MPPSSPRDAFAFPLAAARWSVAGSLAASAANLALTFGRLNGESPMPDLLRALLPGLIGQGLLGAALVAVLVFVVAERRQTRAPDRVGHARAAAATTGLVASVAAWAAVSVVSALAYSQIAALQSPAGFALVGVTMSLLHVGVAAFGASVGAALLVQPGEASDPAAASRHGWAGVAVFGATLAFGIDLVIGGLPGLLHDALGAELFATAQWSPLVALLIGTVAALGYGWRRRTAAACLPWRHDVWAACIALPVALLLTSGLSVATLVALYLLGDGGWPALIILGLLLLLTAGAACVGLGALAGALRLRWAARTR